MSDRNLIKSFIRGMASIGQAFLNIFTNFWGPPPPDYVKRHYSGNQSGFEEDAKNIKSDFDKIIDNS